MSGLNKMFSIKVVNKSKKDYKITHNNPNAALKIINNFPKIVKVGDNVEMNFKVWHSNFRVEGEDLKINFNPNVEFSEPKKCIVKLSCKSTVIFSCSDFPVRINGDTGKSYCKGNNFSIHVEKKQYPRQATIHIK